MKLDLGLRVLGFHGLEVSRAGGRQCRRFFFFFFGGGGGGGGGGGDGF